MPSSFPKVWVPVVNNAIFKSVKITSQHFHAIKTKKKANEGIKHEGVILLANVLLTAFSFLSLIFFVVFLDMHSF